MSQSADSEIVIRRKQERLQINIYNFSYITVNFVKETIPSDSNIPAFSINNLK